MVRLSSIAALLAMLCLALPGQAEQLATDWKETAKRLQTSVVTVRIRRASEATSAKPAAKQPAELEVSPAAIPQPSVTVCTGFCVAPGKVVTAALATTDDRIRLTLAGGLQSDARLLAVDEYTGLSLLSCDRKEVAPLSLSSEPPAVGESVLAGAAWGVNQPVVSHGIIGATERTLTGFLLPPLLQCDLRTVETSSGSPLVNSKAEVMGIVLAIEQPESHRGWTYAIPASHILRLVRSAENATQGGESRVVVLKRRRPVVGMILEGTEDAVVVARITAGGPAEKAGLRVGDQITATDGVAIRSVYQAVLPTLYKQPGDAIRFRVQTETGEKDVRVVLGGGVELPRLSQNDLGQLIRPQVKVGRGPDGNYYAQSAAGHVREVFAPPLPLEPEPSALPTNEAKIELLEKAIERYQAVIELQQQQIRALKEAGKAAPREMGNETSPAQK
jgi:S1-C subfamily serine protease